jgi:hypothetical protein
MCPYYLDGDRTRNGSVIPVVDAIAISRDRCGYCAVFKDRRRRTLAVGGARIAACAAGTRLAPVSQSSTACRGRRPRTSRGAQSPAAGRSGSVDVLGPTVARAARDGPSAPPGRLTALPRKEVIQPQLPLRLPCYDFTPVTSPTVDGSLPCGLGHRLRVLLTPVV